MLTLPLYILTLSSPLHASTARIKDIVDIQGVRGNDLVGYGLVVGLNGTGDSVANSPYTEEALQNMLERLGVNVSGENFRPRNVAAVLVTATLPPFARSGSQVDVTVSAIGDAKGLLGGTLIMTPLNAADGQIYAVAQGQILAGGLSAGGANAEITKGVPTSGVIPGGARVEKEIAFNFNDLQNIKLAVRSPDFTTAYRVAEVINARYKMNVAEMMDAGTINLDIQQIQSKGKLGANAMILADIENLKIAPDNAAKVVVDQRSGTIVMGSDVRISTVAVSQGSLTVKVLETPIISQPAPFSENGDTVVVPQTSVGIDEDSEKKITVLRQGTTLSDLVAGLNALGVGPRDMIDILSTIKASGALHAEFIVR
ncbi:MAG: flagellar basal body P-ring protein FlgI [Pseudomonadota bacterium]